MLLLDIQTIHAMYEYERVQSKSEWVQNVPTRTRKQAYIRRSKYDSI